MDLKYTELLKRNAELEKSLPEKKYGVKVLSNVIVSQISELLEYVLRTEGIPAVVEPGDYDNIVQDSFKLKDADLVVVFWELCNIINGFHYKAELYDDRQMNEIFEKIKSEISLVFKSFKSSRLVLFNKFTTIHFSGSGIKKSNFEGIAQRLNQYLEEIVPDNVRLIELERIIGCIGIKESVDFRYYYSSKALYSINFFKSYVQQIRPFILSANGKAKKALICDCDNTLWKGVLGEEGMDGIEMSSETPDGEIFSEVQSILLGLNRQGVLLGLCSKNNSVDVDEVLTKHQDMQLRPEQITIKKINWTDKVTNLREISRELNIGLESMVYLDDSAVEIDFIKKQLPEIKVLQVPGTLSEYPAMMRESTALFYNLSLTSEDVKKAGMYQEQVKREIAKKEFIDIEDYLASLQLKMTVFLNDVALIPRLSQLSLKTNQFNLTTKRYTIGDIKNFIENSLTKVFAISVNDKFGDSGITGLCIVHMDHDHQCADIDSLMLSCRVIGRNIEYAFMDYLLDYLKGHGITMVKAKYLPSLKNMQVKDFFEKCSFSVGHLTENEKNYILDIKDYKPKNNHYVEVIHERQD